MRIALDAQAILRRRRHQPRRPPPTKSRPGSPAPATGAGTEAICNGIGGKYAHPRMQGVDGKEGMVRTIAPLGLGENRILFLSGACGEANIMGKGRALGS